MENAYAQALWNIVQKGEDATRAVEMLRDMLTQRGRSSLLPRIAKAFARIAQREIARSRMVLYVAHDKDAHKARTEAAHVLAALTHSKEVDVRVDNSLIGGWRLEGGESLVDASFKKHLLSIYNHATQE